MNTLFTFSEPFSEFPKSIIRLIYKKVQRDVGSKGQNSLKSFSLDFLYKSMGSLHKVSIEFCAQFDIPECSL